MSLGNQEQKKLFSYVVSLSAHGRDSKPTSQILLSFISKQTQKRSTTLQQNYTQRLMLRSSVLTLKLKLQIPKSKHDDMGAAIIRTVFFFFWGGGYCSISINAEIREY